MVAACFCGAQSAASGEERVVPPGPRPAHQQRSKRRGKRRSGRKKPGMLSRLIEGIVHLVDDDDDFSTASEGSPRAMPEQQDSGHLTAGPSGTGGLGRRPSGGRSGEPARAATAAAAAAAAGGSTSVHARPLAPPGGAVRQRRGSGGAEQQQGGDEGHAEDAESGGEDEEGSESGEYEDASAQQRGGWNILGGVPFLPKIVELLSPKFSTADEAAADEAAADDAAVAAAAAAEGARAADDGHLQTPTSPGGSTLYPTTLPGAQEAQPQADDEDLQGTTTEPAPLAAGQQQLPELSEPSQLMGEEHIRALAAAVPARYRQARWALLYSTARDGISLQTMLRNASKRAPTVMVVRDFDRHVFGAYCSEAWRLDKRFFGTGETFVFQLEPQQAAWFWWWRRMAKEHNDFFQWCSTDAIAVGGSGGYALRLDADLSSGISRNSTTFGNDSLAGAEEFRVGAVELWGLS